MLIVMIMFNLVLFCHAKLFHASVVQFHVTHASRLAIDNHPHRKVIVSARCLRAKTVHKRQQLTGQPRGFVPIIFFGNHMKRILAAGLVCSLIFTHAYVYASPFYGGFQIDDTASGVFLGYQISKKYAVEVLYSKSDSSIDRAGITVDTSTSSKSIVGIALFPIKLRNVLPCNLYIKAGYQRTNKTETYSVPASVTLTFPYGGKTESYTNQFLLGGGAAYDFTKHLTGRAGIDFVGSDRSVNLTAIYRF